MKRILIFLFSVLLISSSLTVVGTADASPCFFLNSLEEYNQYWKEHEAPEGFITYEQLSFLGEYRWFFYPIEGVLGYDQYGYHFRETTDEKTREIAVIVYYEPTTLSYLNEKYELTPSGYDLREDRGGGLYRHSENLGYRYDYGKLREIYLKIGDVVLGIESDMGGWDEFDPNEDHIICRLLNQKTASAAYLDFVSSLKGTPQVFMPSVSNAAEVDDGCASVVPSGAGMLLLCSTAAVVISKKRKAKR